MACCVLLEGRSLLGCLAVKQPFTRASPQGSPSEVVPVCVSCACEWGRARGRSSEHCHSAERGLGVVSFSKSQQYDCKWYIPLTDLSFQTVDEAEAVPNIPLVPDEELDAMKIKISQIKNDIQREKVRARAPRGFS